MKIISKILFIIVLSFGIPSFSFDTADGNYISQQDVIRLLKDLFYPIENVVDYTLQGCVTYKESFERQDLFELGFINLETGEKLLQEPDSNYVLFLDSCLSKITKDRVRYFSPLYHKILGDVGYKELTGLQEKYKADPASYVSSNGIKLSDNLDALQVPTGKFLTLVEVRVVSATSREAIIDNIFKHVFDGIDIPKEYFQETKAELLASSQAGDMSIEDFISTCFKKAIINDYLLKY